MDMFYTRWIGLRVPKKVVGHFWWSVTVDTEYPEIQFYDCCLIMNQFGSNYCCSYLAKPWSKKPYFRQGVHNKRTLH